MRRYYLNQDGKPCIWPIPEICLWLYGRYETSGTVAISADQDFVAEARLLALELNETGVVKAEVSTGRTDVLLVKCDGRELPAEGYSLTVKEDGAVIEAATGHGAFNGCRTLLQMVHNSFDDSIGAVKIEDRPFKPFRGVRIPLPDEAGFSWFFRFIDLISRYRINRLLLDIGDADAFFGSLKADPKFADSLEKLSGSAAARHIDIIPCLSRPCETTKHLQAIVSLFRAKTVSASFPRPEGDYGDASAALAKSINTFHSLLGSCGAGLAVSSELLHPSTGSRALRYNAATGCNDVLRATCGAIDLICKDILILDKNHGGELEDTGSQEHFASRGFWTVFTDCCGPVVNWEERAAIPSVHGVIVTITDAGAGALGQGGNMLAAIQRVALLTWWAGYRKDHTTRGVLLPQHLEKEIAMLYPMERDGLEENHYPSSENIGYQTIDLRKHYNSPLMHSYWRVDDHFMMYLQDAETLPGSVPFSLFQGVLDFRFENAFVMAGGSWNSGITGIQAVCKARSVSFLHAYIFGKQQVIAGKGTVHGEVVGCYEVKYADGTVEKAEIVYGKDICFWKNYHGTNEGAYAANPSLMGVSEEGLHYTVFAMEWVNPKPDIEIASIDVLSSARMDGRIVLFGITAVK